MTYDYVLLPWPALCIFCLYMFAQSTDLFDQLPSWVPVGRDSLGSAQDTTWFPHVHGLQCSSSFFPSFCTWSCRLIAWTMASMATGLDVLPTVESRPLYIMIRFQVRISLASHDLVIRGWSWNVALCVLLDHGYLCLNLMLQQGLWDCIVSCSCNFPSKKLFV